jgi:amino acid transporter
MTTTEERPNEPKLQKNLSRGDVFFFLVCTLVGLDTLGSVASRGGEGFFWLVFLAVFFFVPYALSIAELGSAFPQEGGAYVWTRRALGRPIAAVTTVFYWVSNPIWLGGALTMTAITTCDAFFFRLGPTGKYAFGLVLIWACILCTVLSLKYGKWVTVCGAYARVGILTLFTFSVAVYGVVHGVHGIHVSQLAPTFGGFGAVVPLLFFNFVGFELPSAAGGEMVDPRRDVPFAVLRAALASILCYGIPILAMLLVLPTNKITGLRGFIDAMQLVFTVYGGHVAHAADGTDVVVLEGAGKALGACAAFGFIVALATSGISWIMGADRSQAVACLDGAGPRRFGAFVEPWGTPLAINVVSGVIASVVLVGTFAVVGASEERFFAASLNLGISSTTISYMGVFPALYLLRRREADAVRPYRVPGGDRGALVVSVLTFGWALFATVDLVWPGFGKSGAADAALPAGFVTRDAHGAVVSSQRALFELVQMVPLALFALVGVGFSVWGRRDRASTDATRTESSPRPSYPSVRPAPNSL